MTNANPTVGSGDGGRTRSMTERFADDIRVPEGDVLRSMSILYTLGGEDIEALATITRETDP